MPPGAAGARRAPPRQRTRPADTETARPERGSGRPHPDSSPPRPSPAQPTRIRLPGVISATTNGIGVPQAGDSAPNPVLVSPTSHTAASLADDQAAGGGSKRDRTPPKPNIPGAIRVFSRPEPAFRTPQADEEGKNDAGAARRARGAPRSVLRPAWPRSAPPMSRRSTAPSIGPDDDHPCTGVTHRPRLRRGPLEWWKKCATADGGHSSGAPSQTHYPGAAEVSGPSSVVNPPPWAGCTDRTSRPAPQDLRDRSPARRTQA